MLKKKLSKEQTFKLEVPCLNPCITEPYKFIQRIFSHMEGTKLSPQLYLKFMNVRLYFLVILV
jgi:hypothetical protein